eukprot:CAMPEP_0180341220 /NCGR_PEP_ID=MMETSP0989-20121125/1084_1 /TAXON_ID=697907 /ORGANISM="non described non described, Strain CCMP2293" /LENGTH=66 /DNA_ID=CAMNT_0022329991 /DNA_START=474 /DNA_END=670 /DNA_ORIENTATION=+
MTTSTRVGSAPFSPFSRAIASSDEAASAYGHEVPLPHGDEVREGLLLRRSLRLGVQFGVKFIPNRP